MDPLPTVLAITPLPLAGALALLWLLSLTLRDASIIDVFWGLGFILVAWTGALVAADDAPLAPRPLLVASLVTLWGLRLAIHIFIRNRGHGEDPRYAAWRRQHGETWWWRSAFQVFALQGVILWIVALPILVAVSATANATSPTLLDPADALGALVVLAGIAFETTADLQLARFKADANNTGKIMNRGLWGWSRHPNYFGDAVVWWGLYGIAAPLLPWGPATVVSPILMTWLLVRVSGVAMLERGLKRSKPGWDDHVARTSAFVPRPPRSPRTKKGRP